MGTLTRSHFPACSGCSVRSTALAATDHQPRIGDPSPMPACGEVNALTHLGCALAAVRPHAHAQERAMETKTVQPSLNSPCP